MLDLRFVRDNLDTVKQAAINKNEQVDINQFINLDSRRREILQTSESLKQQRNTVSEKIALMKRSGENTNSEIEAMRKVSAQIKEIDESHFEEDTPGCTK